MKQNHNHKNMLQPSGNITYDIRRVQEVKASHLSYNPINESFAL